MTDHNDKNAAPAATSLPRLAEYALCYVEARARGASKSEAARLLGSGSQFRGTRWRFARTIERWNPAVDAALKGAQSAASAAVEDYLKRLRAALG